MKAFELIGIISTCSILSAGIVILAQNVMPKLKTLIIK
jgi:hypothetical protein